MTAGDKKPRNADAEWPPKMAVCVGAVVCAGRRILLVRQAAGQALAGQWSIPWGVVEAGEAPEDAALRETREEAGVTAEVDGLLGVQNLPSTGWLGIVFLCHPVAGQPAPDGIETDEAAFLSLEEMNSCGEPIEPWCEWLARRVLAGEHMLTPCEAQNPYRPRRAFL